MSSLGPDHLHERSPGHVRPIRAWPINTIGADPVHLKLKFHMIAATKISMIMIVILICTLCQVGKMCRPVQHSEGGPPTRRAEGPEKVHHGKVPHGGPKVHEKVHLTPRARISEQLDITYMARFFPKP